MENKEVIEKLEEYINDGMWLYVEPPLGKEECELFLKLLKQSYITNMKLLEDGTLVINTDLYPEVKRVLVEHETSGTLYYSDGKDEVKE